jgi:hypothetical protein
MFEKILQKLKEQRGQTSSVSDRSLEDLAKTFQLLILTDEQLTATDFTAAIKSIQGNIDHQAAEASKKAAEDKSKKEKEDAKKAEDEAKKKQSQSQQTNPPLDEPPAWAKTLMDDISALKSEKVSTSRTEKLKKSLNGLPEFYTKPVLSSFQKAQFATEEEFDVYLKDIETNRDAFNQATKEQGLNSFIPGAEVNKPVDTGETPIIGEARKLAQKEKERLNKTT